jgi:hypothetical protein
MARQRFRAAQWAVLIDEWNASGLNLTEFCQRRGLCRGTMQGWVYKPALKRAIENARRGAIVSVGKTSQQDASSVPSPAFLPVRLVEVTAPAPEAKSHAAIEVVLAGGRRIGVSPGFDPETLRRVVAALEA